MRFGKGYQLGGKVFSQGHPTILGAHASTHNPFNNLTPIAKRS
jgi:hypothetical protein